MKWRRDTVRACAQGRWDSVSKGLCVVGTECPMDCVSMELCVQANVFHGIVRTGDCVSRERCVQGTMFPADYVSWDL